MQFTVPFEFLYTYQNQVHTGMYLEPPHEKFYHFTKIYYQLRKKFLTFNLPWISTFTTTSRLLHHLLSLCITPPLLRHFGKYTKIKDGDFSMDNHFIDSHPPSHGIGQSWPIVRSLLISFDEIKNVGSSASCHNLSLERNNE